MDARDANHTASVMRPTAGRVCIIITCSDTSEADQIGRQLLEQNMACLVTYRRVEDLMHNRPTGKVALFILATVETSASIGRALRWLRSWRPHCPIIVLGDVGGGEYEIAVRSGGAYYLTRPVSPLQWSTILTDTLRRPESTQVTSTKGS